MILFLGLDEPFIIGKAKKSHGVHKMAECVKCSKENEVRRLIDGLCSVCSKRKAKTVVGVPVSKFLSTGSLYNLAQ
jgi:hypothetical protein